VRLRTSTSGALGNLSEACISMQTGTILSFKAEDSAPWRGGHTFEAKLEGFSTAAASEDSGRRLVQAFLWTAISRRIPLQLVYQSYEPAYVFERNRGVGFECRAFGEVSSNTQTVTELLHEHYYNLPQPSDPVLLSLEIFAGARLESSERAVFIAMVSALEPLAEAQSLGEDVGQFVDNCLQALKDSDTIDQQTKASLKGRLAFLRDESIRGALKRVVKERLSDHSESWNVVDEAYNLRSEIVHNGKPNDLDVDLQEKSRQLEEVILALYATYMSTGS